MTGALEDYCVELRDKDGRAFECMHFGAVSDTLDKDEEILFVPLGPSSQHHSLL